MASPITKGVLVGCDKNQEGYLPWWWLNYRLHNHFPVTFIDFGMNDSYLNWCKKRGSVISVDQSLFAPCVELEPHLTQFFRVSSETREVWFKKPNALLSTPYETSIWIDCDCIVRNTLEPLFEYADNEMGFNLIEEPKNVVNSWRSKRLIGKTDKIYNTGVVVFKKDSSLLKLWVEACSKHGHGLRGDQEALSLVINQNQIHFKTLPHQYHWLVCAHYRINPNATILHFAGPHFKYWFEQYQQMFETLFNQKFSMEL